MPDVFSLWSSDLRLFLCIVLTLTFANGSSLTLSFTESSLQTAILGGREPPYWTRLCNCGLRFSLVSFWVVSCRFCLVRSSSKGTVRPCNCLCCLPCLRSCESDWPVSLLQISGWLRYVFEDYSPGPCHNWNSADNFSPNISTFQMRTFEALGSCTTSLPNAVNWLNRLLQGELALTTFLNSATWRGEVPLDRKITNFTSSFSAYRRSSRQLNVENGLPSWSLIHIVTQYRNFILEASHILWNVLIWARKISTCFQNEQVKFTKFESICPIYGPKSFWSAYSPNISTLETVDVYVLIRDYRPKVFEDIEDEVQPVPTKLLSPLVIKWGRLSARSHITLFYPIYRPRNPCSHKDTGLAFAICSPHCIAKSCVLTRVTAT